MDEFPEPSGQQYNEFEGMGHGDDFHPSPSPPQQPAAKVTPMRSVEPSGPTSHSSGYPSYFADKVDPRVLELLYWRQPLKSGVVLALLLAFELGLVFCSVISVIAYAGLFLLIAAASLRAYTHVFKKADGAHPFKDYLETDFSISRERTEEMTRRVLDKVNAFVLTARDLFLISNYVESCKLAVGLYLMTYIGARFNFLTLCILITISAFSMLKLYDTYQDQFDQIFEIAKKKVLGVWGQIRKKLDTLPVVGKKDKAKAQ